MKTSTFIFSIIAVAVLAGLFFVLFASQHTHVAQAGPNHNVFGAAWGASDGNGIGWVGMNNCDDVADAADGSCAGVDFGVAIDSNGDFSGAAWSSNYGWVEFNDNACGPGPSVDLNAVEANGSAPIEGWIHVYSMQSSDGFWDGCIKMSDPSWNDVVTLYDDGDINGVAWGAQVVGWVSFDAVSVAVGCTDSDADNYEPLAVFDDGSCQYQNDICPNISGIQSTSLDVDALLGPGWISDQYGNCIVPGDICPNLTGVQTTNAQVDAILGTTDWSINSNNGYCVVNIVGVEVCNNQDDDGDGLIDEGLVCTGTPGGGFTIPDFEEI